MKKARSWTGVILLAFLASALAVVGFLVSFRTFDSVDALDASVPFDGFLMTTVGIGIAVAACRMAAKLVWLMVRDRRAKRAAAKFESQDERAAG